MENIMRCESGVHWREILCTERLDFSPVVNMKSTAMQSLNVQVHGILEGHGREGQTVMPQAVQEGIEVHLIRETAGRFRFRFFRCGVGSDENICLQGKGRKRRTV